MKNEWKDNINEIMCGQNFAYVLNENIHFSTTDYKVLQSQKTSCFVKCMKMKHNGQVELYYLTKEYKSLSALISRVREKELVILISSLLKAIVEAKQNDFLSCQNIDISFEKIYIDVNLKKVFLTYVPIVERMNLSEDAFEKDLRKKLVDKLRSYNRNKYLVFSKLILDIENQKNTIEHLAKKYSFENGKFIHLDEKKIILEMTPKLQLVEDKSLNPQVIVVDKSEFFIGKNSNQVDGAIRENKTISRVHCKIMYANNKFYVVDLNSSNFTYLNQRKLQAQKMYEVKNEDVLSLSNSVFKVIV